MNKKGEIKLGDILSLGFGGIFAVATVILAHNNSGWGFITFIITILAWIPSMSGAMTIATVFAFSGFMEIFGYQNKVLGFLWLIISCLAYFLPHLYHMQN